MATDDSAPEDTTNDWLAPHQPWCLACGPENPAGMGLKVRLEGERIVGEVTFRPQHEGAPGYAHGGAVATILDDALGYVAMQRGQPVVTGRLEVDYRAPVVIDAPLVIEAWEEADPDGRKHRLRGVVRDPEGTLLAEARGLFITVDPSHFHGRAGGEPEPDRKLPW